jgi:GT2 family glycosyltransferase
MTPDSPAPVISVVVLSYNRPHHLREALGSLLDQGYPRLEVVVVDNRSRRSAEVARVVAAFPTVRFLPQQSNRGFAAGMNAGLRAATGEYVHLTEDDILLDPGFYTQMLRAAERPGDHLYSGVVYDRPSGGCFFAGAELAIGRRYVQRSLPPPPAGAATYSVGMILGAMVFGRRRVLERLGGFREEFFMYFEDAEFCWRASLSGVGLWVVPMATGQHLGGGPAVFRSTIEFHKLKNYLALNALYASWPGLAGVVAKFFAYTSVRKAVEGRDPGLLARSWAWAAFRLPGYLWERAVRRSAGPEAPTR